MKNTQKQNAYYALHAYAVLFIEWKATSYRNKKHPRLCETLFIGAEEIITASDLIPTDSEPLQNTLALVKAFHKRDHKHIIHARETIPTSLPNEVLNEVINLLNLDYAEERQDKGQNTAVDAEEEPSNRVKFW